MITAVLTGDIMNSRTVAVSLWMNALRSSLAQFGQELADWEIFRGDSFQLVLPGNQALYAAVLIKAKIKELGKVDVRIAIGLGEISYKANQVSSSNGTAFVHSGLSFESLKKRNLSISSGIQAFDMNFNLLFDLYMLQANSWTSKSAEIVYLSLLNPELNQQEIAEKLKLTSQSTISKAYKRAAYEELKDLLAYYELHINTL